MDERKRAQLDIADLVHDYANGIPWADLALHLAIAFVWLLAAALFFIALFQVKKTGNAARPWNLFIVFAMTGFFVPTTFTHGVFGYWYVQSKCANVGACHLEKAHRDAVVVQDFVRFQRGLHTLTPLVLVKH